MASKTTSCLIYADNLSTFSDYAIGLQKKIDFIDKFGRELY